MANSLLQIGFQTRAVPGRKTSAGDSRANALRRPEIDGCGYKALFDKDNFFQPTWKCRFSTTSPTEYSGGLPVAFFG
jgi:hypothetical protein